MGGVNLGFDCENDLIDMADESIISSEAKVLDSKLLLAKVLKVDKYLTHGILEAAIDASLLLMAAHKNLIQLDEKVFVVLPVTRHRFSKLHIQILLHLQKCKSLPHNPEISH